MATKTNAVRIVEQAGISCQEAFYDFDENGSYQATWLDDMAGSYVAGNGKVIENSTLVAEIGFTIKFFGLPVEVNKYHMVDVTD